MRENHIRRFSGKLAVPNAFLRRYFLSLKTVFYQAKKGFLKFAGQVKKGDQRHAARRQKINYLRGKNTCLQINYHYLVCANSRRLVLRFSHTALNLRAAR